MDIQKNRAWDRDHLYFFLCQFARQVDTGVLIVDPQNDHKIAFVNQTFTRMTGYHLDEIVGSDISFLNGPLTNEDSIKSLKESFQYAMTYKMAMCNYRKNKSAFWNEISSLPVRDEDGKVQYYYIICRDVTNMINIENVITLERDVYAAIEEGKTLTYIMDHICNEIARTFQKKCNISVLLTNESTIELVGMSMMKNEKNLVIDREKVHELLKNPIFQKKLSKSLLRGNIESGNLKLIFGEMIEEDMTPSYWSHQIVGQDGEIVGIFSMVFAEHMVPELCDIQFLERMGPIILLALKYIEQKNEIRNLAYYDQTTELWNLTNFKKSLQKVSSGFIYIFEPSEFQNIIGVYGRDAGDDLLRQLAERLLNHPLLQQAKIARYTSSSIILALLTDETSSESLNQYLKDLTLEPYNVNGKQVYITLKIGTSNLKQDESLTTTIQKADAALSAALKTVGTVIYNFTPSLIQSTQVIMDILSHMSKAIADDEFFPVLQPKVDMQTGEIESFEALARWISPQLGFVSPAVFIPVAENTGNIHHIDRGLLKKVLAWQKSRLDAGKRMYQVSVNISPPHFYHPQFVENMVALIAEYGICTQYIKFEVTESMELENVMRAKKIIDDLKSHGIETSIDDFGVGYSSLSYLQELPFDEIKIDKSFVDNLHDRRMSAVVKTIIQLSADLQMKSVAEGIETKEQFEHLKAHGLAVGQGYYFYKPLMLADVEDILDASEK